jgi:hypothetical protein
MQPLIARHAARQGDTVRGENLGAREKPDAAREGNSVRASR